MKQREDLPVQSTPGKFEGWLSVVGMFQAAGSHSLGRDGAGRWGRGWSPQDSPVGRWRRGTRPSPHGPLRGRAGCYSCPWLGGNRQEAAGCWKGISGFRINAVYTPFPYEN